MRPRHRHLALAVRDEARSRASSERYFGFDGASAQRYAVEAAWEIPQPHEAARP